MSESRCEVSGSGDVWVVFNGLRALDGTFYRDMSGIVRSLGGETRSLTLYGGPDAFSVGNHLAWVSREVRRAQRENSAAPLRDSGNAARQLAAELAALEFPTFAVMTGPAVGAGLELAALMDFIIVIGSSRIRLPEAQLGVLPDLAGVSRLGAVFGRETCARLLLGGKELDLPNEVALAVVASLQEAQNLVASTGATSARGPVVPLLRRTWANEMGIDALTAAELNDSICGPASFLKATQELADQALTDGMRWP